MLGGHDEQEIRMTAQKFRKKPVVIDAHPAADIIDRYGIGGGDVHALPKWVNDAVQSDAIRLVHSPKGLRVNTLEGEHIVSYDDMLIRGVKGELYGCKPDIFAATYDAVASPVADIPIGGPQGESDLVQQGKAALRALDASAYGGSAEHAALAQIGRENRFIRSARTLMPQMIAEIEQLRRGGEELGNIIRRQNQDVLDLTGLHHLIGEDGDGDWGAVWENLAEMAGAGKAMAEPNSVAAQAQQLDVAGKFAPLQEVTLYQARCTSCGRLVEDYGDFSCMPADDVINEVRNLGWFERTRTEPSPRPDNPHAKLVHTVELLCPDCQKCEVCGADARADELDEHLVCEDHADHEFEVASH